MFWTFFTPSVILAAVASFFIGSFGYVIAVMVIRPVVSYGRLRRDIRTSLAALAGTPDAVPPSALNALAVRLTASCREQLPLWYQRMLANRGERPSDAARRLTRLAGTRNRAQVMQRIEEIRADLRLNP